MKPKGWNLYVREYQAGGRVPKQRIGQWMEIDNNKLYVHSELGYISPEEFEEIYLRQVSLKQAA